MLVDMFVGGRLYVCHTHPMCRGKRYKLLPFLAGLPPQYVWPNNTFHNCCNCCIKAPHDYCDSIRLALYTIQFHIKLLVFIIAVLSRSIHYQYHQGGPLGIGIQLSVCKVTRYGSAEGHPMHACVIRAKPTPSSVVPSFLPENTSQ